MQLSHKTMIKPSAVQVYFIEEEKEQINLFLAGIEDPIVVAREDDPVFYDNFVEDSSKNWDEIRKKRIGLAKAEGAANG